MSLTDITRRISEAASSPTSTVLAFLFVIAWAVAGPFYHYSEGWQFVINTTSSVLTLLLVFVLNNAEDRDTVATHIKLDSIILAIRTADNRMIALESKSHEEVSAARENISEATKAAEEVVKPKPARKPRATKK